MLVLWQPRLRPALRAHESTGQRGRVPYWGSGRLLGGSGRRGCKHGIQRTGDFLEGERPFFSEGMAYGGPVVLHEDLSSLGRLGNEAKSII